MHIVCDGKKGGDGVVVEVRKREDQRVFFLCYLVGKYVQPGFFVRFAVYGIVDSA